MHITSEEEALARAMCEANAIDPDQHRHPGIADRPNWVFFVQDARNAIAAHKFFAGRELAAGGQRRCSV